MKGDKTTELYTCGLRKEIKSCFNQKIIANNLIKDINISEFDALAIPGGFEEYGFYEDAYDSQFFNLIERFKDCYKIIASICVGALPVAKSGILKKNMPRLIILYLEEKP